MKKISEISERINELIDYLGISPNNFSKKLGYDRAQTVYDVLNGKSKPSYDFFSRLYNTEYSDIINEKWLFSGDGEMLKGAAPVAVVAKPGKGIPLVTIRAIAGLGNAEFNIKESDVKATYVVPKFNGRKVDFMIEVYGSSMYPKYNSGDVVACTIIRESSFIQWNKVHVIATREQGILVKRLKQADEPCMFLAVSDNKEYPPFLLPKEEITGIALVVGVIRLE